MSFCKSVSTGEFYQQLLQHPGSLDKVYASLDQDNFAQLTNTALEVLKETKTMPKFERKRKSEKQSIVLRKQGNKLYAEKRYQTALKYYNQALLFAPHNSDSMLLAYSNRSALLLKTKNYSACMKDIEMCLNFKCAKELLEKLTARKFECEKYLWREQHTYGSFPGNYFQLNGKQCHPKIPCLTNDVLITVDPETQLPQVVAARDIKVGAVIGFETAFTSLLNPINYYICCYFCHKMSLNLIPCSDCTYALFCDNKCKQLSFEESHKVECSIMELLHGGFCGPNSRMAFRTVIKTQQMCETWKEFVDASHNIGTQRMRSSSLDQIYNGNYKFSMLNFLELREPKAGAKFCFAFLCAIFIEQLKNLPFYLPRQPDLNDEAINALSQMAMAILLKFYNKIELHDVAEDRQTQNINWMVPNYGVFGFASKLRHQCDANILPVALNTKIGLIALHPIKKGTELTLSYIDHAYDYMHAQTRTLRERRIELYRFAQFCNCAVCTGNWRLPSTLSGSQRMQYRRWMTQASDVLAEGDAAFKATCEMLAALRGLAHTSEHLKVYMKFRSIMLIFQFLESGNYCPEEK